MTDLVAEAWEAYSAGIPLGPNEREGLRIAFFCGATVVFHLISVACERADAVSENPTPEEMATVIGIGEELEKFAARLRADTAARSAARVRGAH